MKITLLLAGFLVVFQDGLEGDWEGALDAGGVKLRLVLHVTRGADGALKGSIDSIDQGAAGLPVDTVSLSEGTLRLELKALGASFEGKREGGAFSGHWKQGGASLPLTLRKTDKPSTLSRPQEPKKPYPYDEEEVSYSNAAAGVKLAGTLTLPRAQGPVAAALLITGSGPQDRNETILGHRPFLVLADSLTRRGFAVLRVDDRGVGGSTGSMEKATSLDFAGDVRAGVEFLKSRKEIDPKRIGLIGHSEGALIAPLVASDSADVAFIVLLAGPGTTGERILLAQGALLMRAAGVDEVRIARNRGVQERFFTLLKRESDDAKARVEYRAILEEQLKELSEEERGQAAAALDAEVRRSLSPWMRFFVTYDAKPALRKLKCPVLALNGEKDLQVPAGENLQGIAQGLEDGGNPDYTVVKLPGLNHLFQTCKTGSVAEYGQIEETFAPIALETLGDWLKRRFGP